MYIYGWDTGGFWIALHKGRVWLNYHDVLPMNTEL